jgi:hypothetical protein
VREDVIGCARLREQCDGLGVDVDRLSADDVQEYPFPTGIEVADDLEPSTK